MTKNAIRALVCLVPVLLFASACDRAAAPRTAEGATAGEKLDRALERAPEKLAQVTSKTKEELSAARVKGREAPEGASAGASDTAITASIKASLLKDPDLSAIKIEVDTHDGVVALNGSAPDEQARERAGRIAEATKGVREVHNHVTARKG
jgi:osmotically-inducible protein OsmY